MIRCLADESLQRKKIGPVQFPLGVYPIESMKPVLGYSLDFEPGDGGEEEEDGNDPEWERWPDRYVYDIVVSHERLDAMLSMLLSLMPGRVFPILDFLGHDAHREVDPYIAYELCGIDRVIDGYRRFRPFFLEDGMVGFGAMSEDPFFYLFLDEHKVTTVRCEPEQRRAVEKVLEAFELQEVPEPAGSDAAAHEHRNVLLAPDDQPDLLSGEEIVEHLRDRWRLTLNVDPDSNVDEEGRPLGVTPWRCLVRCLHDGDSEPAARYLEVLLHADCLRVADELALDASYSVTDRDRQRWLDVQTVAADRLEPEYFGELVAEAVASKVLIHNGLAPSKPGVVAARWLGVE